MICYIKRLDGKWLDNHCIADDNVQALTDFLKDTAANELNYRNSGGFCQGFKYYMERNQ